MKPAPFSYHRPGTLEEALGLFASHGAAAKPLAGGQSLGPMLNMRLARPAHLVDLNDLIELDYVRQDKSVLEIGALTRHHRIATAPEVKRLVPVLAAAAASIGHYAIRQRGTLGGSLCHADPAAQLPLLAVALDAEMVIASSRGTRRAQAEAFFQSIMMVDLAEDELLTAARFSLPEPDTGWAFELFSRRHGDFAIASIAALLKLDADGAVAALRIAIGGAGSVPLRLHDIEANALGERPGESWIETTAEAVAQAITFEDDPMVPAQYRQDLVRALAREALSKALGRCLVTHGS
ncbi:FAD binding domain-containing protein [Sinisalibacter lacisalsi]|uniref:Molybdopterin dehydrogenase n=1 Tax=Sinisalibacter lacisalsi TaxID=1526570 RepID=A0ABQ1QXD4_9RHOB|nr:xanthine dehydrogenase family protein subunit M [Sinisalibacter lacisalsi]GGD47664.1 molybdopterin dehydrogenase [Sinisalibacter lacisalsi]